MLTWFVSNSNLCLFFIIEYKGQNISIYAKKNTIMINNIISDAKLINVTNITANNNIIIVNRTSIKLNTFWIYNSSRL